MNEAHYTFKAYLLWMGRLNGREGTDHMTPYAEAKKD